MFLFYVCIWFCIKSVRQRRYRRALYDKYRAERELYDAELALYQSEYEHYKTMVDQLREQRSELSLRVWWFEKHNLACKAMKQQLEKLDKQLYNATLKMSKAEIQIKKFERKIQ